MKFLALTLFLVTTSTYAAECRDPYHSVSMTEEVAVADLGDADSFLQCNGRQCSVYATLRTAKGSESYLLLNANQIPTELSSTSIEKMKLKIYKQTFSSLCSSVIRTTIGLDYNEVRFRDLEDITFID